MFKWNPEVSGGLLLGGMIQFENLKIWQFENGVHCRMVLRTANKKYGMNLSP